jgi:hypothetical protein
MTYMYDGGLACSGGSDEIRYILKNEVGFPYLDADIDDPSQTRYFSIGDDYRTRMQTNPEGVRQYLTDTGKETISGYRKQNCQMQILKRKWRPGIYQTN